jgi:hypothetical protein
MGFGLETVTTQRPHILADLAAQFLEREVVEVVAERVLDLDPISSIPKRVYARPRTAGTVSQPKGSTSVSGSVQQ